MTATQRLIHENAYLKAELDKTMQVLELIPKCPIHGQGCRQYQAEWIANQKLNKTAPKKNIAQRIMNFLSNI